MTGTPVTVVLLAVNVLLWVALEATGGSQNTGNLLNFGAKYGPAIADGEWWRLVFPIFLHIGFFHLVANSFALLIFGGMAERTFGSPAYAGIYLLAGVAGNVASYWGDLWSGPTVGAGASGAVFGIIGAFATYLLLNRRMLGQLGRQSFTSILAIIGINILLGLAIPGIDNAAHLGGLVAGAAIAWVIAPRERIVVATSPGPFAQPYVGMRPVRPGAGRLILAMGLAVTIISATAFFIGRDYPFQDQRSVSSELDQIESPAEDYVAELRPLRFEMDLLAVR